MITQLEKLLTSFFIRLPDEIKQSLEFNHGISFDAGVLGERINYVLNGTKGTASNGGGSFDATDGSESKACFYGQPSTCKSCGAKVNYYSDVCTCGSTDLKPNTDTRWGISCSSHFKYLGQIPFYQLVTIRPLNKDLDCLKFQLDVYRIEGDDPIFNEILERQLTYGHASKNLMPLSLDFYMSSPTHILSVNITIADEVSYDYEVNTPHKITTVPAHLFSKKKLALLPDTDEISVETVYQILGLPPSNLGKPRGITKRKTK